MAEIIRADLLQVGDVFFDPRRAGAAGPGPTDWHPAYGLRRATKVRDVIYGNGSYRTIDYVRLDDIATGQLDMRRDIVVCRVQPVKYQDAQLVLAELKNGERYTVWCAEGRLWA